ncbi:uncharacterized protein MELLADRAFT_87969 [Melampsora larici-populina 98AG31]|uniref:Secreted protein n=1 Tax=Melampsora larici-populina (strain 98AG31 / pathotype 3-4-7) TaxID=747676 RepID=F4RQK4_MELLP|nr:uncharacterized protein MELLADRAFT_87969 [Melampsora larici-populina 98AG31]EGG05315.1 hypothetical protein MELLADRAFT_87969 [Melampsora larici-populina 98AG31]
MRSFTMKTLIVNIVLAIAICAVKGATTPPSAGIDPTLTQKCVKTFHGTWLDAQKIKQTGYACSTTGNTAPNDVYLCKKIVTEAEASGCGNTKKTSKCQGGYTSPLTDNKKDDGKKNDDSKNKDAKAKDDKTKDDKSKAAASSAFCRDTPGSPTMKCDTIIRPTVLGECVKSGPNTHDEHKNDWLSHKA